MLVSDVDGMTAGKEGLVMKVRDDILLIGCRSGHLLDLVLARAWEVLPEPKWRRLNERERFRIMQERGFTHAPQA